MSASIAEGRVQPAQLARKLRRNPHVGAVLHAPQRVSEEKTEGESKQKRARAYGPDFNELTNNSRIITYVYSMNAQRALMLMRMLAYSRNPFIGSRHSLQAIHYSSNNLKNPPQSSSFVRVGLSTPTSDTTQATTIGIFVPLACSFTDAPSTRMRQDVPHQPLHSLYNTLPRDPRKGGHCPVLVDLPGLGSASRAPFVSCQPHPPTHRPHDMMSVSLPGSIQSHVANSASRAQRERSYSGSTAASVLSADSTPSGMQASNASSVGDDSTAVRQLQARWARVDGGFAFAPALRRASHLRTVLEVSPELLPQSAPSSPPPSQPRPSLLKPRLSFGAGVYGIQLRPLELSAAWATGERGRGDTGDSRDMELPSPSGKPDAFPADVPAGFSSQSEVVHLPRQNETSVDLKAALLDNSVLAFNPRALSSEYDVGRAVGDGGYAVVKAATHRSSGRRRAVKFIRKRLLFTAEERCSVKREVEIHAATKHENIVRMVQAFEDPTYAMLVIEWMPGGSLKRYLDRRALKIVPEVQVRIIVRQVLQALHYIHKHKIVHCDVKPENILLGVGVPESLGVASEYEAAASATGGAGAPVITIAPHTIVKLCDFGNARRSRDARYFKATGSVGLVPFSAMHGTMGYMAPEVLAQRHYSTPVDMWALGVLTYTMLSGTTPFKPYHSCQAKNAQFEGATWERLSSEARDFCRGLLQRQPSKRTTAEQALSHAWLSAELE